MWGVKGREGGVKEDSQAFGLSNCGWLVVPFTEMGNPKSQERIWGVDHKLCFAMLNVRFIIRIKVEIMGG